MSRFSIHIKRGLSKVLLVVFLHYLIGITCFVHSHYVGNGFITHSHYPFSSQGVPLKTHPPQVLALLSALSGFVTEEVKGIIPDISPEWDLFETIILFSDFQKKSTFEELFFLRGPPSFS